MTTWLGWRSRRHIRAGRKRGTEVRGPVLLSAEFKQILYNQRRSLVLLWLALFVSVGLFLSMRDYLLQHLPPQRENYPYTGLIRICVWVITCITAAFLLWSKNSFYSVEALFRGSSVPALPKTVRGETPAEKGAARVVSYYRSRMVAAVALAETIAIFGLLLGLIGDYLWEQRALSLMSGALLILFYPSRAFFEELIQEYQRREIGSQP